MIGELTPQQIEQFLHDEVIGRIGCHARDRTYIVPVTYVYDGTSVVGQTGNGMKVRMMRENPNVCFEVDRLRDRTNWQSVIAHGVFEELHGDEAATALHLLLERLRAPAPSEGAMAPHGAGRSVPYGGEEVGQRQEVMYRISIQETTGRFEMP
jgi:uncharacterized protein